MNKIPKNTSTVLRDRYIKSVAELKYKSQNEYTEINYAPIVIPAGDQVTYDLSINSYGAFLCDRITGTYTTKSSGGNDNGICELSLSIEDTTLSRNITNGFIPANLLFSPGRIKSIVGAGDASNFLYVPLRFNYFFDKNSDIKIHVKSTATEENQLNVVFLGTRYADRS